MQYWNRFRKLERFLNLNDSNYNERHLKTSLICVTYVMANCFNTFILLYFKTVILVYYLCTRRMRIKALSKVPVIKKHSMYICYVHK